MSFKILETCFYKGNYCIDDHKPRGNVRRVVSYFTFFYSIEFNLYLETLSAKPRFAQTNYYRCNNYCLLHLIIIITINQKVS